MAHTIGILGLQGCITPHLKHLEKIGAKSVLVRDTEDFAQIEGLIIPGGESTAMLRLIDRHGLKDSISKFVSSHPVWGICAGSILIAQEVTNPAQFSFNALNIRACRNFYGSQLESFSEEIESNISDEKHTVDFIRAPRLEALKSDAKILAKHADSPVLIQQGNILASAFHTELRDDPWLHDYFKSLL